jgi:phytoene synthase
MFYVDAGSVAREARSVSRVLSSSLESQYNQLEQRIHGSAWGMSTATQNKTIPHKTIPLARSIRGEHITNRVWSVDGAYQYCEELARSHYENFPVGSILIPRPLRKHFYSIYAFARTADDFADEGYTESYSNRARLELLEEWRNMLRQAFTGSATHPVFVALRQTQAQFDLPITLFEDLLSAFMQDVTVSKYASFDDLRDYCRRSANPVGRLILLLYGYRDEQRHSWSDDICTALQLANHWQDVAIDLAKDRIYIPAEDLARFNLSFDDLKNSHSEQRFRELMQFEVARARELFARGKPLCVSVSGRLGLELRAVWLGGARILDLIERNNYDVFERRPVITSADKLRILSLAARKGAFRRH